MRAIVVDRLTNNGGNVDLTLKADLPTYFMGIAGTHEMKVSTRAVAQRGSAGKLEMALVLDNTWSMSAIDSSGQSKLDSLRTAAKRLVEKVSTPNAKLSLVPYAEMVNVNPSTPRSSPWLNVPPDQVVKPECYDAMDYICVEQEVAPCQDLVGGLPQPRDCGCKRYDEVPRNERICPPAYNVQWWGCVGMRMDHRVDDSNPSSRYPGYVEAYQYCPTPILPLGSEKTAIKSAIDGMQIQNPYSGHRPETYLPIGLMWGLNTLSPEIPYSGGEPYDPNNANPRKVLILMTDGDNTMALDVNGRPRSVAWHASDPSTQESLVGETNTDTAELCEFIKTVKQIEIYSIAFMVGKPEARKLLENCSTDKRTHYFDAVNANDLLAAFEKIGSSLTKVRLVQ